MNRLQIAVTETIAVGVTEELERRGRLDGLRFTVRADQLPNGGLRVAVVDSNDKAAVTGADLPPMTAFSAGDAIRLRALGVSMGGRVCELTYSHSAEAEV